MGRQWYRPWCELTCAGTQKKKPGNARLFHQTWLYRSAGAQFLHARIQVALMTRRLVAVNDALVDHRIDHRHSGFEIGSSLFLVALVDRTHDALDRGAQLGAGGDVMGTTL